jgi:glycosyltransferase involved in cell wall biosynthesis
VNDDRLRVLYVSYDGVLEPLGESQVVSYIERLASAFAITLLSFEKPADTADAPRVGEMERRLEACGIEWVRRRYHKRPPVLSTLFDVIAGIVWARRVCRAEAVRIVHARSYVPALIALGARGASRAAFLFDMRGFWVDEKVEAGHWTRGGLLYRVGKWWERRFFCEADGIVSLTAAGVRAFPDIGHVVSDAVVVDVIPTCVDLQRFAPRPKDPELLSQLGLTGALVIGCIGTMSNWYMRDEMLAYLSLVARSLEGTRIVLVTREDHEMLRRSAEAAGILPQALVITSARFSDMPRFASLFDVGVFFIRPSLSKRASAATKLAEFLACGVPVIINDGVGDSGAIVRAGRAGLVLSSLDEESFARSLPEMRTLLADAGVRSRCRSVAADVFDLDRAVERYASLYRRLAARPGQPDACVPA